MLEAVSELHEILTEEVQLVKKLLNTAIEQSEALVTDNLSKLMKQNEELEVLAEKLQPLEDKRVIGLLELTKTLELEQEPSLRELALESSLPEEFRQVAKELWELLQKLREQNELNEMLLKQSLHYNQKMQLALNHGGTYQPDGKLEQRKASSLLDHSI